MNFDEIGTRDPIQSIEIPTPTQTPEPDVIVGPSSKRKITPQFNRKVKDAREQRQKVKDVKQERIFKRKLKYECIE